MTDLKVSFVWCVDDIQNTVIFFLIKKLSKKKIIIVPPDRADLIIYGCYNWDERYFHIFRQLKKRIKNSYLNDFVRKYEMKLINKSFFKSSYKPVTLLYSQEPLATDYIKTDFSISFHHSLDDENHLRYLDWKDSCDWSSEGILRDPNKSLTALKFGKYFCVSELLEPIGTDILKKNKKMCIFTSHLKEPRNFFYKKFSRHFTVDGYGPWFNKNIKNSNVSNIKKIEIMKNYAFDLCPENMLMPGFLNARVAESFSGKCLPITWADQNINYEFNPKAFVNLNDHFHDNFESIIENLKSDEYLKRFSQEPLLLKKPTLEKEIKFVEKILGCL